MDKIRLGENGNWYTFDFSSENREDIYTLIFNMAHKAFNIKDLLFISMNANKYSAHMLYQVIKKDPINYLKSRDKFLSIPEPPPPKLQPMEQEKHDDEE